MFNPPMQPRRQLPPLVTLAGLAAIGVLLSLVLSGCAGPEAGKANAGKGLKPPVQFAPVNLTDRVGPSPAMDGPGVERQVVLEAARNEWTSFTLQLGGAVPAGYQLRIRPLAGPGEAIPATAFEAYQILPMPVDLNRAAYVRHTGQDISAERLPRALLPLKGADGVFTLSDLRDPTAPTRPGSHPTGAMPVQIWIDVHVPPNAAPGDYAAACEIISAPATSAGGKSQNQSKSKGKPKEPPAVASVPLRLTVYNFALPSERHLQMLTQVKWDSLVQQYPNEFATVTPRLIDRTSPKYAATVRVLDGLVKLTQHHRLGLYIPNLQPTVKWPARIGQSPPDVSWTDFDPLVAPWFKGDGLDDGMGLTYWPLPPCDRLETYDLRSRLQYWREAVRHFDQNDWLDKACVALTKVAPGRAGAQEATELSIEAAELLSAHHRLRVALPLEDDQVQLAPAAPQDAGAEPGAGARNAQAGIDRAATTRLLTSSPGLVSSSPVQKWPDDVAEPEHWLRTDLPGLVPYVGAGGDENDVRLWAYLAFLRNARLAVWGSALPSLTDPAAAADPNELIWFYPGHWFGVDEPVPTVQLKWLRRAQQDYEYLWLARERGEDVNAVQVARLITKPVLIQGGQAPDPTYTLMTGTTDRKAWRDAQRLLTESILLHSPGHAVTEAAKNDLYIRTLQWARPQERPLLLGRTAQWAWWDNGGAAPGAHWLSLRLGLDIYNAADVTPEGQLRWANPPQGWEVSPRPIAVPALQTFQVRRMYLDARFDLLKTTPASRDPVTAELTIDGAGAGSGVKLVSPIKLVVPIAACERREGRSKFDGKLDDWAPADLIHDGPLVRMLDRPDLQRQQLTYAATRSKIYTGWAAADLYVGFAVDGVSKVGAGGRNDVEYQGRRAWGEDLCELLVQPIYDDTSEQAPVLHVVVKPNGSNWAERKMDPRLNAQPWAEFESNVRYAAIVAGPHWTGEVAIPRRLLVDAKGRMPTLLRFNFAQHRADTGESASWAGPVDFGRDDAFTGLIYLRSLGDDAAVNDGR